MKTLALLSTITFFCACPPEEKTKKPDDAQGTSAAEPVPAEITVYSGRNESLLKDRFDAFTKETGIKLKVRYAGTASLAALLLEEKGKSPAAIYIAQDAGALGALSSRGAFEKLPADVTGRVPATYRSTKDDWVGISGRARTLVYNTDKLKPEDLPKTVMELTDAKWKGRVGWAPANGSFQAFVTGLRQLTKDEVAEVWLTSMKANEAKEYPKNSAIVRAVGAGEVDVGLVNHYYLYRFLKDDAKFPAKNHYFQAGDPGALINVAGAGILKHRPAAEKDSAMKLLRFLLSPASQKYFAQKTYEYPVIEGARGPEGLPTLASRQPPKLDLAKLEDLEGTLKMLKKTKALP